MSSRTAPTPDPRASRQQEPVDSYPNIKEPKQSHAGNAMAILSVFAILAFGIWTAIGTFTGSGEKSGTEVRPTVAPTKAPAAAPAPTATVAPTPAPTSGTAAAPAATPSRAGTPAPTGGGRVHVVGPGDTLYKIASLYGTTVDAIMAANGFTDRSKVLHVGDKLTIP